MSYSRWSEDNPWYIYEDVQIKEKNLEIIHKSGYSFNINVEEGKTLVDAISRWLEDVEDP